MKKTLALVLAAVMLLSLLSACKSSADETPTVDPLRVRLALEFVLSVLEQGTPVKTAKCPAKTVESN